MKKDNCESIFAGKCPCSLPVVGTGGCTGICVYGKNGDRFPARKKQPEFTIWTQFANKKQTNLFYYMLCSYQETGKEALDCPERNELAEMEGGLSEENRL